MFFTGMAGNFRHICATKIVLADSKVASLFWLGDLLARLATMRELSHGQNVGGTRSPVSECYWLRSGSLHGIPEDLVCYRN